MNFNGFVGKVVRIDLVSSSAYYYKGKVLEADDEFVRLIDVKGRDVIVRTTDILNLKEDPNGE